MEQQEEQILVNVRAKYADAIKFMRENTTCYVYETAGLCEPVTGGLCEISCGTLTQHITLSEAPPMTDQENRDVFETFSNVLDELCDVENIDYEAAGIQLRLFNVAGRQVAFVPGVGYVNTL